MRRTKEQVAYMLAEIQNRLEALENDYKESRQALLNRAEEIKAEGEEA